MRKYSALVTIKEMQIIAAMQNHFKLIRLANTIFFPKKFGRDS